jgi:hypothetical protein
MGEASRKTGLTRAQCGFQPQERNEIARKDGPFKRHSIETRFVKGSKATSKAAEWASQLRLLVAGFLPRPSGFDPGQAKWDLWWTKWHCGRFYPSSSVPSSNSHSNCFLFINDPIIGTMVSILAASIYNKKTGSSGKN